MPTSIVHGEAAAAAAGRVARGTRCCTAGLSRGGLRHCPLLVQVWHCCCLAGVRVARDRLQSCHAAAHPKRSARHSAPAQPPFRQPLLTALLVSGVGRQPGVRHAAATAPRHRHRHHCVPVPGDPGVQRQCQGQCQPEVQRAQGQQAQALRPQYRRRRCQGRAVPAHPQSQGQSPPAAGCAAWQSRHRVRQALAARSPAQGTPRHWRQAAVSVVTRRLAATCAARGLVRRQQGRVRQWMRQTAAAVHRVGRQPPCRHQHQRCYYAVASRRQPGARVKTQRQWAAAHLGWQAGCQVPTRWHVSR